MHDAIFIALEDLIRFDLQIKPTKAVMSVSVLYGSSFSSLACPVKRILIKSTFSHNAFGQKKGSN